MEKVTIYSDTHLKVWLIQINKELIESFVKKKRS